MTADDPSPAPLPEIPPRFDDAAPGEQEIRFAEPRGSEALALHAHGEAPRHDPEMGAGGAEAFLAADQWREGWQVDAVERRLEVERAVGAA